MKPGGDLLGFFEVVPIGPGPFQNRSAEFARNAAAKADHSLVLLQQFLVDARLEVKAFQERRRGQLDQVVKAGAVLRQQRQVVAGFLQLPASSLSRLPGAM